MTRLNVNIGYGIAGAGALFGLFWLYTENKNDKPIDIIKMSNENKIALSNAKKELAKKELAEQAELAEKERAEQAELAEKELAEQADLAEKERAEQEQVAVNAIATQKKISKDKLNQDNLEYFQSEQVKKNPHGDVKISNPIIGDENLGSSEDPDVIFVGGGSKKKKSKKKKSKKKKSKKKKSKKKKSKKRK